MKKIFYVLPLLLMFSLCQKTVSQNKIRDPVVIFEYNDSINDRIFKKFNDEVHSELIPYKLKMTDATSNEYLFPLIKDLVGIDLNSCIDTLVFQGFILKTDTLTDYSLFIEKWIFENREQASKFMNDLNDKKSLDNNNLEGNYLWLYSGEREVFLIHSYDYSFKSLAMKISVKALSKFLPNLISSCKIKRMEF